MGLMTTGYMSRDPIDQIKNYLESQKPNFINKGVILKWIDSLEILQQQFEDKDKLIAELNIKVSILENQLELIMMQI